MVLSHPIQPLVKDSDGIVRFKANGIVRYLLDNGVFDLNHISVHDFPQEDREQFAQLIGYSWSGACDLSYMSNEVIDKSKILYDQRVTD